MGCLGLALCVQSMLARQRRERAVLQSEPVADAGKEPKYLDPVKRFPFGKLIVCFIMIVIYFAVMERLGFYVSAFLFFISLAFILGRKDLNLRKGALQIGIAFIFTAILFVLFNKILEVQTPKGLLF
jgi:hypothetical protein